MKTTITKSILAAALALGFSTAALAQVTLPYTETFESCSGGALPAGWIAKDLDGDGHNWYTHESSNPAGHNGSQCCARSNSWIFEAGALTPKNELISPNVAGVKSISYWVSASNNNDFAEHYEVWVTANDDQETDKMIFEETLTAEAGANSATDNSTYQYREMNVPAGTKYVSFIHNKCTNQFVLRIDDITFSDKPTSIQGIEAEQLRLYAKDGELCIDTPTAGARVNVFALDGRRVADQPSVAGLNTIALARGYYVVQVGSFTGKVYVP